MIKRIRFANFKALKSADVKLGPFNVIVGPNGSGKSTVFQGLCAAAGLESLDFERCLSAGAAKNEISVDIIFERALYDNIDRLLVSWNSQNRRHESLLSGKMAVSTSHGAVIELLKTIRIFALDPAKIAEAVTIQPGAKLQRNGANLAGVLDDVRNRDEQAFDEMRADLKRWIPEYDSIVFETPKEGQRSFKLRRALDKKLISASDLSEGTLMALFLITIAHHPDGPPLICLEEPDRALHPRLLREVRDALYRLAFPTDFGLNRKPVQVIVTTHSPLFLDLFKDHPEQIIIAEKHDDGTATFKNLGDDPALREMIGDAPLGEVWYSGVLGGVPALS